MKKYLSILVLLSAPFCLIAQNNVNKLIDLKFNLQKGSSYEYSMGMDMNMIQHVMGQDMNITNKNVTTYIFQVVNDSSGWKTVIATLNNIKMNMNAMGQDMVFDTDIPIKDTSGPDASISKMFSVIKGSKFGFIINSKGEIKNITGFTEMKARMLNSVPENENNKKALQFFDENSFTQSIQQLFGGYPESKIKVGDTWQKTVKMNNMGIDQISNNTYTLESVNGAEAIVKILSKLSSSGKMAAAEMNMDVVMTESSEGNMHYNLQTGLPSTGSTEMKMEMKLTSNGMDIPMNMNTKLVITGKKQ